jgi:hypothetical protein
MLAGKPSSWANSTFARTTLPMFGFVVFAWWGLSQLMESKLQIRVSTKPNLQLDLKQANADRQAPLA